MIRCSMSIFVPIPMSMSPPIISEREPTWFPHFFPNSTPRYEKRKVTSPIMRAGKSMSCVLAVSDTPTARASMLVAIPRVMRDLSPNTFFSSIVSSFHFHHS